MEEKKNIRAVIGLGNPGTAYWYTRHNIGFRVLDELVERHGGSWQHKELFESAEIMVHDKKIICFKPQTFMNSSGRVIPWLAKQGIKPEQILVVHDELEKPFGSLAIKFAGSARGHNGLRSIIEHCGDQFYRLRFGIGRPEHKEQVSDWVLSNFQEPAEVMHRAIEQAVAMIEREL
jgi:PTH1 family peptidyl-tRNA hydrolase